MKWLVTSFFLLFVPCAAFAEDPQLRQEGVPERISEPSFQQTFPVFLKASYSRWDKNYFVAYGFNGVFAAGPGEPAVILYDRDGHIAREAIVWFEDARSVSIISAAVTTSGKLVVAGGTINSAGVIANFIAEIGNDGHISRVVRTSPFLPVQICSSDEEGTVWSFGFDRDQEGRGVVNSLVLRQYSFEKGQLQAMLDRSTLGPAWSLYNGHYPGELNLRCNSQTVGIYNGAANQWIEYDIRAKKLTIVKVTPLPPPKEIHITGFALTESGGIFASVHDRSKIPPMSGVFQACSECT
jgi:hypothetical protein